MTNKVAIQGEIGSFHHAAAMRWYGDKVVVVPCASFKEVFTAVNEGLADSAVIAIENSLYGSINEVYDLILKNKYYIVGEIPERIHQCLIGFENTQLDEITHVYSHPVALAQCSVYLDEFLPIAKKVENFDTAASVDYIKNRKDPKRAAIASKTAASLYNMKILKEDIQNNQTNYTRFLVLQKDQLIIGTNKASLVIQTNHKPGALYSVLGVFDKLDLNLCKLQSRPIPGKLWQYMFYIDVEASKSEINQAIDTIKQQGNTATLLGIYKAATKTTDI